MTIKIKICGLRERENIECCIKNKVNMIGFVFHHDSPRNISIKNASNLVKLFKNQIEIVGLVVDPSDDLLDQIIDKVGIRKIQFHGDETPERIFNLKERYNISSIKAIPVSDNISASDIDEFHKVSDYILFDAPPMSSTNRPGGNGVTFDWDLVKKLNIVKPWILSGGLNIDNVTEAISITKANFVDVSSGVEDSLGVKNNDLITKFVYNARNSD
mgnify:FL=1